MSWGWEEDVNSWPVTPSQQGEMTWGYKQIQKSTWAPKAQRNVGSVCFLSKAWLVAFKLLMVKRKLALRVLTWRTLPTRQKEKKASKKKKQKQWETPPSGVWRYKPQQEKAPCVKSYKSSKRKWHQKTCCWVWSFEVDAPLPESRSFYLWLSDPFINVDFFFSFFLYLFLSNMAPQWRVTTTSSIFIPPFPAQGQTGPNHAVSSSTLASWRLTSLNPFTHQGSIKPILHMKETIQ